MQPDEALPGGSACRGRIAFAIALSAPDSTILFRRPENFTTEESVHLERGKSIEGGRSFSWSRLSFDGDLTRDALHRVEGRPARRLMTNSDAAEGVDIITGTTVAARTTEPLSPSELIAEGRLVTSSAD